MLSGEAPAPVGYSFSPRAEHRTILGGASIAQLGATISGNAGPGVVIQDLSIGIFLGGTVTESGGVKDVVCDPQILGHARCGGQLSLLGLGVAILE